jgi:hypothetical protein
MDPALHKTLKGKDHVMKAKVIVTFLLCIVTASQSAFTVVRHTPTDDAPPLAVASATMDNGNVPADLLAIIPVIPLSARHEMAKDDLARAPAVQRDSATSRVGETVLVEMPFSSLQVSPSFVEYLGLTPRQVRSIQRLMDQVRPKTEPLMLELRTISGELNAAVQHRQNEYDEGATQRLAATQARLLRQLVTANSRLQQRIYDVLDPRQRKKVDSFGRTSELTMGVGSER